MEQDLIEFELKDINRAFTEYRRNNEKVPTSAPIRKLIFAYRKERAPKRPQWSPDVSWIQVVRVRSQNHDGDILSEFSQGNHKSPHELAIMYPDQAVYFSYRREQNL